jgi:2,3-bisphosphoglycerate-dependent phosphoglycerate mutase
VQRIFLVRHAAATGQEDAAQLTLAGERQALLLADLLLQFPIERVLSSPLTRAVKTIEPFCARANLSFEIDTRLTERVLSTRQVPDWRAHLERSFEDADYCIDDGESARIAQARGLSSLRAVQQLGQNAVLVTHGNLLALILKSIDANIGYAFWASLTNPDVFELSRSDAVIECRRIWSSGFLPE